MAIDPFRNRPAIVAFGVEDNETVLIQVSEHSTATELIMRFPEANAKKMITRLQACLYQIAAMKEDGEMPTPEFPPIPGVPISGSGGPVSQKISDANTVPRREQCCANCDNCYPASETEGICRGAPPTPLVVGIAPVAPTEEDKKMALLGKPIQPRSNIQIRGFHPPVGYDHWCAAWKPRTEE